MTATPLFHSKIIETFVNVDDFCRLFEKEFAHHRLRDPAHKKRNRETGLCDSEVITLLIGFHGGQYRNFKHFYQLYICVHMRGYFPGLVSYNRFIELSTAVRLPSCCSFTIAAVVNVRASASLTQRCCGSATTNASNETRCSRALRRWVSQRWAGSLVLSCTLSSMTKGRYNPFISPKAMWTIATPRPSLP